MEQSHWLLNKMKIEEAICPICGYIEEDYIGVEVSMIEFEYRICECGYCFGKDDSYGIRYEIWREEWIKYLIEVKNCSQILIDNQLKNLEILEEKYKKNWYFENTPKDISEDRQREYCKGELSRLNICCPVQMDTRILEGVSRHLKNP